MKKNVAVLFGGQSPEHEVSVITGLQVLENLDKDKYNAVPIYISRDNRWYTGNFLLDINTYKNINTIPLLTDEVVVSGLSSKSKIKLLSKNLFRKDKILHIDVFFPCFHGGMGENGGLQAVFEMVNKPYVGSGMLGSMIGMDKVAMKQIFTANNISQAKYLYFMNKEIDENPRKIISELPNKLEFPIFVKPANSGSSIGITKVAEKDDLMDAIELAKIFDSKIIFEEGIKNAREINISVMGHFESEVETSVCEEVFAKSTFLSYEDKYKGENPKIKGIVSTRRNIPADISESVKLKIEETSKKIFKTLNCSGLARVDFLVQGENIYTIEINTIPGSMSFYLWEKSRYTFVSLIDKLIEIAEFKHSLRTNSALSFSSNILNNLESSLKAPKLKTGNQ